MLESLRDTGVIVIGNSHTACVYRAAESMNIPVALINVGKFTATQSSRNAGESEDFKQFLINQLGAALKALHKTSVSDHNVFTELQAIGIPVFMAFGGNVHNIMGLVEIGEPFDIQLSSHPDLPLNQSVRLLPETILLKDLKDRNSINLQRLRITGRRVGTRAINLEIPPPIKSESHIANNLDPYFAHLVHDITDLRITPALVRLKLWKIACSVFRTTCEENGITYCASPEIAKDALGFLQSTYYPLGNCTHANDAYGALLLGAAIDTLHEHNLL
jgi:hypothetical protein